jgi:hypothetical protein
MPVQKAVASACRFWFFNSCRGARDYEKRTRARSQAVQD